MSARERVAAAIYEATYPGWSWAGLAPRVLEEWGRVADAAIAAMGQPERDVVSKAIDEAIASKAFTEQPIDARSGWVADRVLAALQRGNTARGIQR